MSGMHVKCSPGVWPKWDVWVNGVLVASYFKTAALELANRLQIASLQREP